MKNIKFSPPDITDAEINEVIDTLKSGWITTGPKTKLFENKIAEYCGVGKAVCLNSNTAGLELILRAFEIGAGDEVIVPVYTYTASASVINHVGAKIVFVDCAKNSFEMDYNKIKEMITEKTKAIIAVDFAGIVADFDKVYEIVEEKRKLFKPSSKMQEKLGRILVIADAAHSFGATKNGKKAGSIADFSSFSFHAVKNLTTAEGGAVTWKTIHGIDDEDIYKMFMLYSLHGQNKDALSKTKVGQWEYDIKMPGYKCNMTDIMAAIGLAQLGRYEQILARRKQIIEMYNEGLKDLPITHLQHYTDNSSGSGHLYITRVNGIDVEKRNEIISKLAEMGVTTNVHYKPLAMMTAYKDLGYDIKDYPNAYDMYKNEITLPLHTLLTDEEVKYIIGCVKEVLGG